MASHKEYLNNQGIMAVLLILSLLQTRFTQELSDWDLHSFIVYQVQAKPWKRFCSALSFETMPLEKQARRRLGDENRVNITI